MDDYKKLQYALITENLETFKNALDEFDINATGATGMNILHYYLSDTFEYNPYELIDVLVNRGIDLNAKTNQGLTPIRYTVNSKNVDQCKALLKYECNIDSPDSHEVSLLMRAVMDYQGDSSLLEIIKLLLSSGADPKRENNFGISALSVAKSNGEAIDQGVQSKEKDLRPLFSELNLF